MGTYSAMKDLNYWKKKILDTLKSDVTEKSIEDIPGARLEKSRGLPPGTIREWGGKKYKKLSSGKWMRTYTGTGERGELQAKRNVMSKIQKADSMEALLSVVRDNRERFVDESGHAIPAVKEFLDAARATPPGERKKKVVPVEKRNQAVDDIAKKTGITPEKVNEIVDKFKKDNPGKKVNIDTAYRAIADHFGSKAGELESKIQTLKKDKPAKKEKANDKSVQKIRDNYESGPSFTGNTDDIYVGKEEIAGTWKLVESSAPTASHDEKTFNKTENFPKGKDGATINDRDYEKDKDAQLAVNSIASQFDGRALSFDSPVVVTKDGVVISGNNRTMSSKIAARKGTDKKYIEALKKRADRFGFDPKDIDKFKNPRVVFEIDSKEDYSTEQFAKFNETGTKAMSPIESAVKMSKIINDDVVKSVADKIQEFDTLGELYADKKASNDVFNSLQKGGIINEFTRPQYVTEEGITGAGKEFLETVMIGSVVSEANIRGLNREGAKSIRKKLVRAITPLVRNKGLGGYSVTDELNRAIDVSMQVKLQKDKFSSIDDFANQSSLFEAKDDVAIEFAKKLEMKEKDFADFMQKMNANLEVGASGQADMFFGDVETKEQVLDRMLKKALDIFNRMKKSRIVIRSRK